MGQHSFRKNQSCSVLIVDDDEEICTMLSKALISFTVTTCTSGLEAMAIIDKHDFDVVITDLKMPDISGIEVLEYAKRKDEYTEVILMTGYGTLDSAALAINHGVNSYLLKPLQISEFLVHVEKAVASRMFHRRSIELMRHSDEFSPDVKLHVHEITSLYYFIRKLMLSLEIPEIMRITLDESLCRLDGKLAVISVDLPGFREVYAMPSFGEIADETVINLLAGRPEPTIPLLRVKREGGVFTPVIFKGRSGDMVNLDNIEPLSVPMTVADRIMGTLTVFVPVQAEFRRNHGQYLYVLSSLISSVIEHGYRALLVRRQAKTDSLTGISNHRHFHETLDREVSRADRKKSGFALILIDVDNFKRINDTHGHQVGDAVLIDLTARILSIIRSGDILARYGGEEFGLILPDTDLPGTETLASRILNAISSEPFMFSQRKIFYTISIGLAVYDGAHPVKKDVLIATADRALYISKENGKNRLSIGSL